MLGCEFVVIGLANRMKQTFWEVSKTLIEIGVDNSLGNAINRTKTARYVNVAQSIVYMYM